MIPMIAASTGARLRPSASPAAWPSTTTSTFSWTPAPTESPPATPFPSARRPDPQAGRAAACAADLRAPAWRRRFQDAGEWHFVVGIGDQGFGIKCACPLALIRNPIDPDSHPDPHFPIPMIHLIDDADNAGVGGNLGRMERKRSSLPRTKNTISPTPAPAASTATSVLPTARPSGARGCSTMSLMPCRLLSFRVTTTLPMTFASCIWFRAA